MSNNLSSESDKNLAFAEIIESNLFEWTAQCWDWGNIPTFGSLVVTSHGSIKIFGIVHSIKTGSMDPIRQPMAYKKTEEELRRDQPQIFEFLQTTFTCLTVGHIDQNKISYHLAPKPPKIHAFINSATNEQLHQFFSKERFLHMIFNLSNNIFNLDELLIAIIKNMKEKKVLNKDNLESFVETFSTLCKNDYQKLKIFLQRIDQLII